METVTTMFGGGSVRTPDGAELVALRGARVTAPKEIPRFDLPSEIISAQGWPQIHGEAVLDGPAAFAPGAYVLYLMDPSGPFLGETVLGARLHAVRVRQLGMANGHAEAGEVITWAAHADADGQIVDLFFPERR